ncbi:dihydroorotate dehydrogenase (NAD+) catalytic subunit [Desulfobaculum xiamenense]|uniref:Dihydroorotate dehydrogenase n=2 Tax=Desulfobaculum xiamenense TaxID=995050 RepID=A0A846QNY7_9BACT|nr:dihydroorotate dehydrogenase (NAD+) catalytic subunit [Desulfobaculum xiamenense]
MKVSFGGLSLKNPILTASGTFGYGLEYTRFGELATLGGIVVKGLSLEPRVGNPMPRIAETPSGMLNAIGLQNIGVRNFVEKRLPKLPADQMAVIANLYACSAEEFAELAGYLSEQPGVAALEVNISCPNVSSGGILFGQDPKMAARVTEAVKRRAGDKPVIIKLSPNVTDITEIARAAAGAGADILCLINTLSGMAVDARTRRPRLANVIGGLSGPAIKPVALRCVHQVSRAVDVPIIGVGGIASAEDVLEFILVGAHAIQVGTANFIRPDFVFRLVDELERLCEAYGITSFDEYRGSLRL